MKADHAAITRANPVHYEKARIKAAWSIKTDRRLLGIPSIRDELIEVATLKALGISVQVDKRIYSKVHPDSHEAMISAVDQAAALASDEIAGLPPVRGAKAA